MLTVCPKCTLTLAVTATDLRTGQGYVRCGRCATVFNALVALTDEAHNDTASTQPNPVLTLPEESANDAAPPDAAAPPTAAASSPAPALPAIVETEATDSQPPAETPDPVAPAAASGKFVESHATGTLETIVLEGEGVTQTEEFVDIETIDSEIAAATRRQLEEAARAREQRDEFEYGEVGEFTADLDSNDNETVAVTAMRLGTPAATAPEAPPAADPLAAAAVPPPPLPAARPATPLWGSLAIALLLLLALQLTHHWRNDLATSPSWYALLSKPYRLLGMSLVPNWDLRAYDLRLLDTAANDGTGEAISVSISLANHAQHAQPFPVLRLSQFDHFGKRVGTRDLQPAEYLGSGAVAQQFMKVSQRVDTRFAVGKAGPEADNFELDVCLTTATGFRCANDEPLQAVARS